MMPEIQVRPATAEDIPAMVALEHGYTSDFVWQMELQPEENRTTVIFREVRLPRSVRVEYPHGPSALTLDWEQRPGLLVACIEEEVIGYASILLDRAPQTAWVTDLVVKRRLRRQGIGSALMLAASDWGTHQGCRYIVLEMQPKNYPAIHLVQKLGFVFSGYNDRYYANHDIGLFFSRSLR